VSTAAADHVACARVARGARSVIDAPDVAESHHARRERSTSPSMIGEHVERTIAITGLHGVTLDRSHDVLRYAAGNAVAGVAGARSQTVC
jgi:hypothetical protein